MGAADWTALPGGLIGVRAGITSGVAKPSGGGAFCYAMKSTSETAGAFGNYATPQAPNANFNPLLKGGLIAVAMRATAGAAAFAFLALQGAPSVTGSAYQLGVSPDGHIELRKGSLASGGVLVARGSESIPPGAWAHLALEVVVNFNGDNVINAFESDLDVNPVTSPIWAPVPGFAPIGEVPPGAIDGFLLVDDPAGLRTASPPLVGGRAGYAARFTAAEQATSFDQVVLRKQI